MLKLFFENVNGERCVSLHGMLYSLRDDARGIRDKFWLKRTGHKNINYSEFVRDTRILFKYNRNKVSCENWGEVIASLVGSHSHTVCVKYSSAQLFDEEGNFVGEGVVCPSYKTRDEVEVSGFSLQSSYKNLVYDNCRGKSIDGLNTINGFVEALKNVYGDKVYAEDIEQVRNDLLKQAIFDFVLAQTDRHWLNTTFIISKDKSPGGKRHLRKAACYDNGCISMLKRKESAIQGMSREIGKQGKDSPYLDSLLKDYCPMMGIRTSTVAIDVNHKKGGLERLKVVSPEEGRKNYVHELALEIVNNPEVAPYYLEFDHMVKDGSLMKKICKDLELSGDMSPGYILKMVGDVMGHQVEELSSEIRRVIQQINNRAEEEECVRG